MNELGVAILNAMRDQGWLVIITHEDVITVSPSKNARATPAVLFQRGMERKLRIVLMTWIVVDGFQWPWPPDHREEVHGEVPRTGW